MSAQPLSIGVLGVGNIGSTFAYFLSKAGHSVTAIARPRSTRLAQLERSNAIILQTGESSPVTPVDHLDPSTPFDLLIVTVMDHQLTAGVLQSITQSQAKHVQCFFNTFRPESVVRLIGEQRCSLGMPFIQAMVDGEGRLKCVTNRGRSLSGDQRWVDVFNAASIPVSFEPRMALWLRSHASVCIAFESISVTAVRGGGGATWEDSTRVARGMQQGLWLNQQLGYELYGGGKGFWYRSPVFVVASILWSLSRLTDFRELLATGEAECRAMCDTMLAAAAAAQPPIDTPALRAVRPAPLQ